jgi:hypothetical protein
MTTPRCQAVTYAKTQCKAKPYSTTFRYEYLELAGQLPNAETCCAVHLTNAEKDWIRLAGENRENRRVAALDVAPACWSWPFPPPMLVPDGYDAERAAWAVLERWQAGRCAVCAAVEYLINDHDHQTGLVRGQLCTRCNGREANWQIERCVFGRYRSRPPTAILNLTIRYISPVTGPDTGYTPRAGVDQWTDNALAGIGL